MNQATNTAVLEQPSLVDLKPKRSNYKTTVVVNNAGVVIDQDAWKDMVKGHRVATTLKKNGLHQETIFMKDQYEAVKVAYYAVKHDLEKRFTDRLIDTAFEHTGVHKTKGIERTIRAMLPTIKRDPTTEKLKKIENLLMLC